jgi:hypothetical protein
VTCSSSIDWLPALMCVLLVLNAAAAARGWGVTERTYGSWSPGKSNLGTFDAKLDQVCMCLCVLERGGANIGK